MSISQVLPLIIICMIIIIGAYYASGKIEIISARLKSVIRRGISTTFENLQMPSVTFSENQKKIFSLFCGWTFLNFIFLLTASKIERRKEYFWPLDRNSNLKEDYGIMEFLVYVIVPALIFYFYNHLNKTKK